MIINVGLLKVANTVVALSCDRVFQLHTWKDHFNFTISSGITILQASGFKNIKTCIIYKNKDNKLGL